MGQVMSVDRENSNVLLSLPGEDRLIAVHFPSLKVPGFVRTGAMVRVRGGFDASASNLFTASSIHRDPMGGGHDPTGVRDRIGRGGRGYGGFGGRGGGGRR